MLVQRPAAGTAIEWGIVPKPFAQPELMWDAHLVCTPSEGERFCNGHGAVVSAVDTKQCGLVAVDQVLIAIQATCPGEDCDRHPSMRLTVGESQGNLSTR